MVAAVRTPLHHGESLALGNKRYRKQLLKAGPLHYQGGVVDITDQMIGGIVDAFDAKAQTRVPFQLADAQNNHTMDPERRRGFVTALHQTSEGLDGIIELEDSAAALVDTDPEFGVSVLVSPVETGEGQSYPAVLQHVLGTYSPVVTTLGAWELAASQVPADGVIDFLALAAEQDDPNATDPVARADAALARLNATVERAERDLERARAAAAEHQTTAPPSSDEGAPSDPPEGDAMPKLAELLKDADEDDLKALRTLLGVTAPAADGADTDPDATDTTGDDATDGTDDSTDDDLPTDEEINAMLAADDAVVDAPATVAASQTSDEADQLALALAQRDETVSELRLAQAQMRRELDDANWKAERDRLAADNVPGVLIELAKPFLHGSDNRLALSQDGHIKAAAQVRKMLTEFGKLSASLRLGQPAVGSPEDTSEDAATREADKNRASAVNAHLNSSGLRRPRPQSVGQK